MKLDKQRILSLFALFTDLPDQELSAWEYLCVCASEKISSRLRADADASKNSERLCNAAAALAYCDYAMLTANGGASKEIRVGDISVKNSADTHDAVSTRDYFLEQISDLIEGPAGFAFRSTGDSL